MKIYDYDYADGFISGDLGALEELKAFDISEKIKFNKKA